MLRLLERSDHVQKLRVLLHRWRAEENAMETLLAGVEEELERLHREAAILQITGDPGAAVVLRRCRDLQLDVDEMTTELVHVRMGVRGLAEEIAAAEQARAVRRPFAFRAAAAAPA